MIMLQYSGILFMTHKAFKSCTSIYVHFILCPTEHHVPNYIELPKSNYDNNQGSTSFARFHIYVNRVIDRQYICVYICIYTITLVISLSYEMHILPSETFGKISFRNSY